MNKDTISSKEEIKKLINSNNYNIFVLKDYVYCTHGEQRKNNALEILKRNIGKDNII